MNGVSQLLLPSAIFLIIPIAILLGRQRPWGPILVTSVGALVVSAVFWIPLDGFGFFGVSNNPANGPTTSNLGFSPLAPLFFYGGLLLVVAGWTLAINASARAGQGGWILLLVVTGYLSFLALLISVYDPNFCLLNFEPSGFTFGPLCPAVNPAAQDIVKAAHLLGPATVLVYALVMQGRHRTNLRQRSQASGEAAVLLADDGNEITEPDLNQGVR